MMIKFAANKIKLLKMVSWAGLLTTLTSILFVTNTHAASFSATLKDQNGDPIEDAAIYLEPVNNPALRLKNPTATIDQINKTYVPLVSIIQTGTSVVFPNKDNIRHHVYSFSPSKTFELKLYSGIPAKPVEFDKAGLVILGCNIHDGMVAYVMVVDTPWFAKSDNSGIAKIDDLPSGEYIVNAWHFRQKDLISRKIGAYTLDADKTTTINLELKAKAGK